MRRFLKHRKEAESQGTSTRPGAEGPVSSAKEAANKAPETLAEGIDEEVDRVIPEYYDVLGNIPDVQPGFQWMEDGEGQVINQHGEFLRLVPAGSFTAPPSRLTKKIDDNIRQIQETRKLVSKISVIKQMQVQTQVSILDSFQMMRRLTRSRCTPINSPRQAQSLLWNRILSRILLPTTGQ